MSDLDCIAAMRDAMRAAGPGPRHFDGPEARRILQEARFSAEAASRCLGTSVRTIHYYLDGREPSPEFLGPWQSLLNVLDRANANKGERQLAEGVRRLLDAVNGVSA